jgi:signal transduction histidine kinase
MADYCTVDLLARDGSLERVAVSHVNGAKEPLLWELARWVLPGAPLSHPLRRALVDGESTLVSLLTDEMLASIVMDEAHGALLAQIAPRSVVTVPLTAAGKVIGCLAMYGSESGRRFDAEDLALAQELASRAALAVENARLFHEAELATRARDHMLGIVAHDLRNPLGTILMASQLLEDTLDKTLPAQRQVAIMRRAGKQMNRLIQDLLDVKRMENDRLSVEPRPTSVLALLSEAVEMLRPLAGASALELTLELSDTLPDVAVDSVRVQQVLSNLVGNAVKFTPKGGRITLRAVSTDGEVRIAVVDTGPGIPAEQIPHVFGQFWQGARADRRGIGLGLAIAKGIVEAHRGRIWVESTVGEGSSFYFTLPVQAA